MAKAVDTPTHAHQLPGMACHLLDVDRHVARRHESGCARHDAHARGHELEITPVALDRTGRDETVALANVNVERAGEDADAATRVLDRDLECAGLHLAGGHRRATGDRHGNVRPGRCEHRSNRTNAVCSLRADGRREQGGE
jgi:hypothetical protein